MSAGHLDLFISTVADFAGVEATCYDEDSVVIELGGWKAYAEVRRSSKSDVILDLAPVIASDDTAGLITIPAISHTVTKDLPEGKYRWDLIPEDDGGVRYEPILEGSFTISRTITQPA